MRVLSFLSLFLALQRPVTGYSPARLRPWRRLSSPGLTERTGGDKFPSIDAEIKTTKEREKVFSQLAFPTAFTVKVIGSKDETFMSDILGIVENITSTPSEEMNVKTRDTGRFLSITVSPVFRTSHQIYAVYEAVCKDKRVKYVL